MTMPARGPPFMADPAVIITQDIPVGIVADPEEDGFDRASGSLNKRAVHPAEFLDINSTRVGNAQMVLLLGNLDVLR